MLNKKTMKLLRYFLPVLLVVFTFCACDDWFGNDDPSQFSDYFKMEITRCERVADVLIVDFKMKNVSGKDLQQVELSGATSKDNLGNGYSNQQDVSLGGKWSYWGQKSIKKNETITGSFRISGFDKTNSAQKLTLNFKCASSDLNFNGEVSIANIKIADKRVLTDGIESLLRPFKCIGVPAHELAMMMTIALRFIPTLIEETDRIIKAQTARGADFDSGSLLQRARNMLPILIPLFISAFRRADELAIAMEARCYRGGEGRTRMHELVYKTGDFIALLDHDDVLYLNALFEVWQ